MFRNVLSGHVKMDWDRNTGCFWKCQQSLKRRGGVRCCFKTRRLILEWKFIPAVVYWQKEGESRLLLEQLSCLPCLELWQRSFCTWNLCGHGIFCSTVTVCLPSTETAFLFCAGLCGVLKTLVREARASTSWSGPGGTPQGHSASPWLWQAR